MNYLISTTEIYRIPTEKEVNDFIRECQNDPRYILGKYSSEYKVTKVKGEIVDEYYKVTVTKEFTDLKEPEALFKVDYEEGECAYDTEYED